MKIYKTDKAIVIEHDGQCYLSGQTDWDKYINRDGLFAQILEELQTLTAVGDSGWVYSQKIVAPIGSQEVWAAGVTYLRSKTARMEESKDSGGATFYDKVYEAERPEIFFKATAHRVVGTNDHVRIRKDSSWDVPEPELTLLISSSGKIQGYTVGNDMSSRSIEGENPLYLPQAKTYERAAGLGPCILVTDKPIKSDALIAMTIERDSTLMFEGAVGIDQMKRTHEELVGYLFRECSFPVGCFLMTGTSVVPDNSFTLQRHDVVRITIEEIGTLINYVE